MNVAFFLTPKSEVITLNQSMSIEQAMDTMEAYRYTSVPVIDHRGRYINALSEGDLLWHLKSMNAKSFEEINYQNIHKIKRHYKLKAVSIDAHIDSLIDLAAVQAFVPVVDDANIFIGIIKRSDILNYCTRKMTEKKESMYV